MIPVTKMKGGERVFEFEDLMFFVLESGVFQMAGSDLWSDKVETGELSRKGIGLNRVLYREVMKSEKKFVVYDKMEDRFLRLQDKEVVAENVGVKVAGSVKIFVTPLEAYEDVEQFLEEKLREKIPERVLSR